MYDGKIYQSSCLYLVVDELGELGEEDMDEAPCRPQGGTLPKGRHGADTERGDEGESLKVIKSI